MFTCVGAVGEKQSGVEMQGRQKRRAAGLGDGTPYGGGGTKWDLNMGSFVAFSLFLLRDTNLKGNDEAIVIIITLAFSIVLFCLTRQ